MNKTDYTFLRYIFLIITSLFASLVLLYPHANTWASDHIESISINADNMRLNVQSGESTYMGNVKISQGQLILTGEEITVLQTNNIIHNITIFGSPARYTNTDKDGEVTTAESEKMIYNISTNKLEMTTNAFLQQPNHRVSSQKIIYDTKRRMIIAGESKEPIKPSYNTENNRVNITLTPKKKSEP